MNIYKNTVYYCLPYLTLSSKQGERLRGVVISVTGNETSDHWIKCVRIPPAFVGKNYHPFGGWCSDIT